MNPSLEYPWLAPAWERLMHYRSSGRIPQALLITGPEGVGKERLAEAFVRLLLCQNSAGGACGTCRACLLLDAQTHPDYLRVAPAEPGKAITVDTIRGLVASVSLKPQFGTHRVAQIAPAHMLNVAAANSLLKTLEEPDERTLMLLISDSPAGLPATILSRCQRLNVRLPEPGAARAWLASQVDCASPEALLAMAQGAPLRALRFHEQGMIDQREAFFDEWLHCLGQPFRALPVAEKWHKASCEQATDWMISWTVDLIRLSSAPACANLGNPDLQAQLQPLAERLNSRQLFGQLDRLQATRRALAGQANRQLALEELLIRWSNLAELSETLRDLA